MTSPLSASWSSRLAGCAATARCRAPATCGELVQGATEAGDFLVNCPIDLFSEATVETFAYRGIRGIDTRFGKVERAIEIASRAFRLDAASRIDIRSPIPRGKGMASSTADMSAALGAFLSANAIALSPSAFGAVLAMVEPGDCVHYPGIAHIDHLTGRLYESLPVPPGLNVLVFDCGGEVETLAFDRERARAVYRANADAVCGTLRRLKHGLKAGDPREIGQAATESAALNQKILHKPQFDALCRIAFQNGAFGVNCAHSGSVLGIVHGAGDGRGEILRDQVASAFGADLTYLGEYAIIDGGCHGGVAQARPRWGTRLP